MNSKQRALPNREIFPPATSWGAWRATEASRAPVVLVVDADLGFVCWLGQIFSEAGCQVVPTLNAEQTVSITRALNLKVDIIVVDPALAGISELIQALSSARPLKIIAVRNHGARIRRAVDAHATLERPSGWGPVSQKEWLECVHNVVKDVQSNKRRMPRLLVSSSNPIPRVHLKELPVQE